MTTSLILQRIVRREMPAVTPGTKKFLRSILWNEGILQCPQEPATHPNESRPHFSFLFL